jgi:ferric-dicitrate binding protein FerR (iron transport regulator)
MADIFDTLLFEAELSSEERAELREQFDEDPALADAWTHWRAAHRHIRERLQEQLPDRRLLVLYVLEQEGHTAALSSAEREALAGARDDIARAIEIIPALERVAERIREERADFNEIWEHRPDVEGPEPEASGRDERFADRSDRSARRPQSQDGDSVRRWTRRLVGVAVVVALAVAATLFWMQGPDTTTVTVADGSVRTVALQDGSTVRLVGPATFTHPTQQEGPIRRVTLDRGRAFFDVQHQGSTSFSVRTPTAAATVLGTQFGVTTTADTTEVVLASGSVRVDASEASGDRAVVLEPGQKSWVAKGETPATPSPVDLTAALEWTGLFVFRSVPMEVVAQRLSQRYDVQISAAAAISDEPITGTFERQQPVQQVLDALAATLGAEVQQEDEDHYRLVPTP